MKRMTSFLVGATALLIPLAGHACPNCGGHSHGYSASRHYYTPGYTTRGATRSVVSVGVGYSAPVYRPAPAYRTYGTYGTRSHYYRSQVCPDSIEVDVQRELARRGYYAGAIDGVIGRGSRAAIQTFQANNGLCVTGQIDTELLRALDLR